MTDFVSGFREAIQDLLIPEFKSLQTEVRGINERLDRMDQRFDRVDQRFERVDERFERVDQRFDRVDQRFERVDERFERVDQQILELAKSMSSMNGKLDILVEHIMDYKETARLTVRVEQLEKQAQETQEIVRTLSGPLGR